MPTIYDLTYATLGRQLLPPDKRNTRLIAFVSCLLAPMQWLRDLWMGTYRTGDGSPQYSSIDSYAQYARAQYGKQVWESTASANVGHTPGADGNWMLAQPNFIGLSERLAYNCQTIVLTWALNKWFGTPDNPCIFRQPAWVAITSVSRSSSVTEIIAPAHGYVTGQTINIFGLANTGFNGTFKATVVDSNTLTYPNTGGDLSPTTDAGYAQALSDIYILNNAQTLFPFVASTMEAQSSDVFSNTSSQYVINAFSFNAVVNFTIYVPLSTLDASVANNLAIFRAFAGKYIPAGLIYNLQNYS